MHKNTAYDKINGGMAPVLRRLNDVMVGRLGTKVDLVRIRRVSDDAFAGRVTDVLGHAGKRFRSEMLANVVIAYPFPEAAIFDVINEQGVLRTGSFDLNEFLPVKMFLPFNGDFTKDPIAVIKDDILIDIRRDANGNQIPVILEAKNPMGSFNGKHLTRRRIDLTLMRQAPDRELREHIIDYLASAG